MVAVKKINTVLVGGVFDILHFGHIHFLKEAKALGNYLIVIIESDQRVKKLKGSSRPFHNQDQRKEILESLKFVDEVIILKDEMSNQDYFDLITKIHPNIIAVTKGDPMYENKKRQAGSIKAKIFEIKKVQVPSTTQIAKLLNLE